MFQANGVRTPSICIVVPCYNEAQRLDSAAFQSFFPTHPSVRFLFVDDGSHDATIKVLEDLCRGYEVCASLLKCKENGGKAEAVRRGVLHALEAFQPESVGYWDADLATPLEAIPDFIGVMEQNPGVEMVFGARVQLLGRHVHRKAIRHYLGRAFATVASQMLRLAIYDTQCGAKLFRVTPATAAAFSEPFVSRWIFDVEVIARYLRFYGNNAKYLEQIIFEYPLKRWTDIAGSKVKLADFFVAMRDIFLIRSRYLATRES